MRICHVTNWLPGHHNHWGGAEQACYKQVKLLAENGVQNYVLFTKPDNIVKEDSFIPISVKTTENYFGRASSAIKMLKLGSFPFDVVSFVEAVRIFRKIKPDLVHLHEFNLLSFSVLEAAKLLKIPTILSVYGYWYFCPLSSLFNEDWEMCKKYHGSHCAGCLKARFNIKLPKFLIKSSLIFRKDVFNHFLSKIDTFIVLSESSANILKDYGIEEEKIHTIPLFFSIKKFELKKSKKIEKNSILYSGWVAPSKGLHILIQAMPEILKKFPDLKLYILGIKADEKYFNYIKELIKKFGIENSIIWSEKRFFEKEYKDIFQNTNLLIVPEQWENMSPVIIIEGMAIGKSIVASKVGGIPEFIKDGSTGYLVNPTDPSGFANKIAFALEQEKITKDIGKNARKFVIQFFDEKKTMKKLIDLYDNLIYSD